MFGKFKRSVCTGKVCKVTALPLSTISNGHVKLFTQLSRSIQVALHLTRVLKLQRSRADNSSTVEERQYNKEIYDILRRTTMVSDEVHLVYSMFKNDYHMNGFHNKSLDSRFRSFSQ